MKLIQLKHKGENLFLLPHDSDFKNGSLGYFISGQGHFKSKKYQIVEGIEMPERWDKNLTWLDVAKFYDQYGIEVADTYASCMTAGIVSKQTARGYGIIYGKIKHLIPDNFDVKFFEAMKCDYMMACFGLYMLDIIGMDEAFEKMEKIIPYWLFDDGSSGQFDWEESRYSNGEPRASAWKFNERDEWNYDIDNIPPRRIYTSIPCSYKGNPCSMKEYVVQRYGQVYADIIEAANKN